jgi:ParB-like chromosome segregation protein Spo0J
MTLAQFHPASELFPLLDDQGLEDLAQDIKTNGLQQSILLHPDGSILDGRNRFLACQRINHQPGYRTWNGEGSEEAFVVSLNLHRRHLTESQRAMIAARIAKLKKGANQHTSKDVPSQEKAAELCDVGVASVQRARQVQEKGVPELVKAVDDGELPVTAAAEAVEVSPEVQRAIVARKALHSSESNEWYTPARIVDAARSVMGAIDLDPASCDEANEVVKADKIFSENGLEQEWKGRVWLNPPYGREAKVWAAELASRYEKGDIVEGCLLVNSTTESEWFQGLMREYTVCFVLGRIKFWKPNEIHTSPTHGSAVFYLGDESDRFTEVFEKIGLVIK